jgi:hypothetical protein
MNMINGKDQIPQLLKITYLFKDQIPQLLKITYLFR